LVPTATNKENRRGGPYRINTFNAKRISGGQEREGKKEGKLWKKGGERKLRFGRSWALTGAKKDYNRLWSFLASAET